MNTRTRTLIFSLSARLVIGMFWFLPRRLCLLLGSGAGRLAFKLLGTRTQVALENLALVYGESLTAAQRRKMAVDNYRHLGAMFFECLYLLARPARLTRFMTLEGQEHLARALERGQGAVLFSAHVGNFPLMSALLSRVFGAKTLFRDPSDEAAAGLYRWARDRAQIGNIPDNPRHVSAYQSLKFLKRNGALMVMVDQVENGGVSVDFMGQPALSSFGAAKLALMSRSPILPVFCHREPDSRLKVVIQPEYPLPAGSRSVEDEAYVTQMVADMNRVAGEVVRAHPEQWLWAHRRWRKWRK